MKIIKLIVLVGSAMAICSFQNTSAQNTIEKQDTTLTTDSVKVIYTCPMHSEIISDKPGTCPKCGMELVKLKNGKKQSYPMQHNMGTMMGPVNGMSDMNHDNNTNNRDNMNMMKGMGICMGIMMVIMMVVFLL